LAGKVLKTRLFRLIPAALLIAGFAACLSRTRLSAAASAQQRFLLCLLSST
jgi:hypothetical protein